VSQWHLDVHFVWFPKYRQINTRKERKKKESKKKKKDTGGK
jgi:REP element-mobilizing transposase RayT